MNPENNPISAKTSGPINHMAEVILEQAEPTSVLPRENTGRQMNELMSEVEDTNAPLISNQISPLKSITLGKDLKEVVKVKRAEEFELYADHRKRSFALVADAKISSVSFVCRFLH